MRRFLTALVALLFPLSAAATLVPFDFTTLGSNNTLLANSVTVAGVTASGYMNLDDPPTLPASANAPLWLRTQSDDHGLGVCSEGRNNCINGAGDVNELSNQFTSEGILLSRPGGTTWAQLWVSSLDSGGTNNQESGLLFWSNTLSFTSAFAFSFADFALDVEGDLLALPVADGFDPTAQYVLFTNSFTNGNNNDYLVWKGVLDQPDVIKLDTVPEPATIALLGLGLAGLGFSRRKKA